MFVVTFKKKVNNEIVDSGYTNFGTNFFLADYVKQLIERGFTDISIEEV